MLQSRALLPLARLSLQLRRSVCSVQSHGDIVTIQQDNVQLQQLSFSAIWLRDNCQCLKCFHSESNSRIINALNFNVDVHLHQASVTPKKLNVLWSDGHKSSFALSWLAERAITLNNLPHHKDSRIPWQAKEFHCILKRFQFQNIIESDAVLEEWLEALSVWGVVIVENAGTNSGRVKELAARVAFLKRTQYGEVFSVRAKPGTSNVAYLSGALQLHTDLPYMEYKPGVNMLHCLAQVQGKGGESQLTDCLSVCRELRDSQPEAYRILCTTPVEWSDICNEEGRDYHSSHMAPVICEDGSGNVVRINYSQPQRGSHLDISLEEVRSWYIAYAAFTKALHSTANTVLYKLTSGEVLTFDNVRLVHGRQSYDGERHLEGGYMDWDYIRSRLRVLHKDSQHKRSFLGQSYQKIL